MASEQKDVLEASDREKEVQAAQMEDLQAELATTKGDLELHRAQAMFSRDVPPVALGVPEEPGQMERQIALLPQLLDLTPDAHPFKVALAGRLEELQSKMVAPVRFKSLRKDLNADDVLPGALGAFSRFGGGKPLEGAPLQAAFMLAASLCAEDGSAQDAVDSDAQAMQGLRTAVDPSSPVSLEEFEAIIRSSLASHAAYLDAEARGVVVPLEKRSTNRPLNDKPSRSSS
mgnify:CR=1 FL=1